MSSVFDAFIGPQFDPVFSDTAVAPWAEHAVHIDIEAYQSNARAAVRDVVSNAAQNAAPSMRIALLQGEAGLGKTHAAVAELWKLSREAKVYPAIMQLSVKLAPEEISLWMLRAATEELSKGYFKDAQDRSPLKRLADGLWQHASAGWREAYDRALEKGDDSEALARARTAAPSIRRGLNGRGIAREHEPIIAGLLLAADDASYAFTNWLRGGACDVRLGNYTLPPLATETDRQRALISIATLAAATGAPLLLVFDQIEAVSRIADHAQLGKLFAGAVQLVEGGVPGTGVVFSALSDTFDKLKSGHLDAGFVSRIESGIAPVILKMPDKSMLRAIIDKRAAYLLALSGVEPDDNAGQEMAPDWLLTSAGGTMLRRVLQVVRDYRSVCREAGHFLDKQGYEAKNPIAQSQAEASTEALAVDDFDELWADEIDADVGAVANIPISEKADLFEWLAKNIVNELPQISATTVERIRLSGADSVLVFDLQYQDSDGVPFERWKVGLIDAPNSQGRLRNQVVSLTDNAHNALPAILRVGGPLPRIGDNGEPKVSIKNVRGANGEPQAGEALANFLEAGGRIAPTVHRDWIRLRLARKFVEARRGANGFATWQAQRRFLLNTAGIGVMTRLVQPRLATLAILFPQNAARTEQQTEFVWGQMPSMSTNTGPQPAASTDSGAHADILVGRGLRDGSDVRWRLDKDASPALPNFGLMVSGDAGQGKTQVIKAVIADVANLGCPILIFDFKNDYGGDFSAAHDFTIVDLNDGLPFNPLQLPPHGASGSQAINHIYEIAGLLGVTLSLGDRQKALLRQALEAAFTAAKISLRDWVDPDQTLAPSLQDVIGEAQKMDEGLAAGLVDRLGLLHGKRLLPGSAEARMRLADLLKMRAVLSFHNLPNDDQLKRALAELILIQLQGHMLRGDQPRALRRLLIFDEAWRAADSKRLIQIAREGRAFGVGVVAGTQFADDLSGDLTGNLASKLYLYNSDAAKRRKLVQALLGSASGAQATELTQILAGLKQFQAVFTNQQYTPCTALRVTPYFERTEALLRTGT